MQPCTGRGSRTSGSDVGYDAVPASRSLLRLASCSSRWSVKTWAMTVVCSRVRVVEVPDPTIPQPTEALIRVTYA
ncbi:hypothetical protein NMP99_07625 [Glutamicibacter mishrai]|uniref:hypothetical protein n=1 Tax=Glutamicibacter mishrai TaxID=1775880 RepID=UPI0020CF2D6E|nr:hypothetical protein [Glutamicibacter mishrai]UTT41124.1 hypothetical protein NMP99_07625 [Glutamicibacter mishrai]